MQSRRTFITRLGASALLAEAAGCTSAGKLFDANRPASRPKWAILQRRLISEMSRSCEEFYAHYFDERGYFLCFERWGANDGPDDAIENLNNWPLLHAIGAPDSIKSMYSVGWEGHLRQYSEAATEQIEIARDGMFHNDFNVQFDWQHLSEGLSVFNVMGLSEPDHAANRSRTLSFAGLYMGENPLAPNWDPERLIIRSLMNGSRGPMLRDATALDWAGDPFDVSSGFYMAHGEGSYEQTLEHYREYTEVVGDHPLNLFSTTLALNAFMITGAAKYKNWLLSYVDAWSQRARDNDDILPSNIGLDGGIGSSYGGRWWAGTYGWDFSPLDPVTGERANRNRVPRTIIGFFNAYLVTGDDAYLDVWRRQTDTINAAQRTRDGVLETPTMYGAEGWYGWRPGLNHDNALDIWWFSMSSYDRHRAPDHPWIAFLEGRNADWPELSLRSDLEEVNLRTSAFRADQTTPEKRLADAVLKLNPAVVTSLLHQTMGAIHIARPAWSTGSANAGGAPLYARIRHFDPERRRAGLPDNTAALVTAMTDDSTRLELVNLDEHQSHEVIVQGGGYGEHELTSATIDGVRHEIRRRQIHLRIAASSHSIIELEMKRYTHPPTMCFPWDR